MFKITYLNAYEVIGALHQLKKHYKVSNNEIAEAAGVSPTTVSKWLTYKVKDLRKENKDKLEDFIAKTWQPGLICITSFGPYPHNLFFNVGDIHDPFFTWINANYGEEDEEFLKECEKAVTDGTAKLHIVKYYRDMDEANILGRQEERLYSIGAMTGGRTDVRVTFIGGKEPIIKNSLVFNPPEDA